MRAQMVAILSVHEVLKYYKAVVIIGGNLFSTYCHGVLVLLRRSTINQEAADELRQRKLVRHLILTWFQPGGSAMHIRSRQPFQRFFVGVSRKPLKRLMEGRDRRYPPG